MNSCDQEHENNVPTTNIKGFQLRICLKRISTEPLGPINIGINL